MAGVLKQRMTVPVVRLPILFARHNFIGMMT